VLEASSFNCDTNIDLTDLSLLIAFMTAGNVTLCCP
jgi:hypothetical protein